MYLTLKYKNANKKMSKQHDIYPNAQMSRGIESMSNYSQTQMNSRQDFILKGFAKKAQTLRLAQNILAKNMFLSGICF